MSEKRRIKIEYDGKPTEALDRMICDAMKEKGCEWYAQGYDHTANLRDICFDYDPEKQLKYKEV